MATLALPRSAPLVATFYGSDVNSPLQRLISKMSLHRAQRRIYVSRRLADRWPSPRNVVLPNGVDFEVCSPLQRELACERLRLDPARRWILFGAMPSNPVKGYDLFREVLNQVKARNSLAEELILSEKGQPYERVVLKLNAASCLLFTSRRGSEGSPTVVKEALAVGLPVVSVEVGDVPEMLEGITPGALVPWPVIDGAMGRRDLVRSLADQTCEVLAESRRSNGRERRSDLQQDVIVKRLLEIYREVVAESASVSRYR
jgi:glycosyltransferase involved in cell wall biosynthesis